MENLLYPTDPVKCFITGPSECGKSVILTIIFLNTTSEFEKMDICSPSLNQDFYQKLNKC